MTAILQKFLDKVAAIKREKPSYRQPGDGSDGTCDCIGLVIGALKRIGISWYKYSGAIHGTNYAARKAINNFEAISDVSQLQVGDVVLKAYEKGDAKWTLSKYPRYLPGGKYYNGDLRDYYHIGVVTSVSPLNITHMSSPSVRVDTKLGKWAYHGRVRHLVDAGAYSDDVTPTPDPTPSVDPDDGGDSGGTTKKYATVYASNGYSVKMRKQPTTKCGTYDNVPCNARVELLEYGADWCKISYGRRTGWYMMTKFLKI